MYLIETIEDFFSNVEIGYPIFTDDVFKYVKEAYPDIDKAVFNEYVTRVLDKNPNIIRYQRGIYYKAEKTPDGYSDIRFDILLQQIYLGSGSSIIGYMTGPAFMYRLGIADEPSEDLYVVSNNYRSTAIDFENLILIKPPISVNVENYKYLQVLDILYNKWQVKLKPNYLSTLYRFLRANQLSFEKLLVYALEYPGSAIYKTIALMAKEGNV